MQGERRSSSIRAPAGPLMEPLAVKGGVANPCPLQGFSQSIPGRRGAKSASGLNPWPERRPWVRPFSSLEAPYLAMMSAMYA